MGYAAANGDAGHSWYENALDSSSWATKSPHNVNYHLLSMLGHRSLEELTLIAKHVTESYYGKKIKYSYWSGCSTGKSHDFPMFWVKGILILLLLQVVVKAWPWLNATQRYTKASTRWHQQ